jgi:hypothetical protein
VNDGTGLSTLRYRDGGGRAAASRVTACALLSLALWPATMHAQSGSHNPPNAPDVVTKVVAGIVSYTRWPDAAAAIRLCTIGRSPGVDALQRSQEIGSPGRAVAIVAVRDLDAAERGCDALYLAQSTAAHVRQAVRQFAGRPVLMLGEGADFCSDGGMFCLEPAAPKPRFGVNLDAVARSGLKVNPLVLRVARGAEGAGS